MARTGTSDESRKRRESGRQGGPATDGGVEYHDDYINWLILGLMKDALHDPITPMFIDAEPRIIADRKSAAWDLGIQPGVVAEVKGNPTKQDLLDFLARAARTPDPDSNLEYRFVYAESKPFLHPLMSQLLFIANEAGGDTRAFDDRIEFAGREEMEDFLAAAGEAAPALLCRVKLDHVAGSQLQQLIRRAAADVTGSEHAGQQLVGFLTKRILTAMTNRMRPDIRALMEGARQIGIPVPEAVVASSPRLPTAAHEALCILQSVPDPLPICVVAKAVGAPQADLPTALAPLLTAGFLTLEDDCLRRGSRTEKAVHPKLEDVLAQALTALIDYFQTTDTTTDVQVPNARALAEACIRARPRVVAPLFTVLHTRLKNLGDKRQSWDIAWLTVNAARAVEAPRPNEIMEYEAQALICGVSWVLQRRGKLTQARAYGEESLELGRDIGYHKNTSFCLKCLGRLRRMMAQEESDAVAREELLTQSADYLNQAIWAFSPEAGEGANEGEEGDCWSLLGRTYMEMGRMADARRVGRRAYELLGHRNSKDLADLLILLGELERRAHSYEEAHSFFSQAIEIPTRGDSRGTEIQARAYFQRGLNWERRKNPSAAVADYKRAESIWNGLSERQPAADARWSIVRLTDRPEDALLEQVAEERSTVRLAVYEMRKRDLAQRSGQVLARRDKPPTQRYWHDMIAEARAKDRSEDSPW